MLTIIKESMMQGKKCSESIVDIYFLKKVKIYNMYMCGIPDLEKKNPEWVIHDPVNEIWGICGSSWSTFSSVLIFYERPEGRRFSAGLPPVRHVRMRAAWAGDPST